MSPKRCRLIVFIISSIILLLLLFTAIGFAPDGSSPTLVQTKTMKQLRGFSPQANYTDRAIAACERS
jgi:hypothetical protein